jgi:hypothetical protein
VVPDAAAVAEVPPDAGPDTARQRPAVVIKGPGKRRKRRRPKPAVVDAAVVPDAAVVRRRPPREKPPREEKPPVVPPPKRERYEVRVVTVPPDAAVFRDGKKLRQRTPLKLQLKPGEEVQLKFAKGGWRDRETTIVGEERDHTVRIRLERRSFGRPSRDLDIPGGDDPGIPGGGL